MMASAWPTFLTRGDVFDDAEQSIDVERLLEGLGHLRGFDRRLYLGLSGLCGEQNYGLIVPASFLPQRLQQLKPGNPR